MLNRLRNTARFASASAGLRQRRAAALPGAAGASVMNSTGARFALRGTRATNTTRQFRSVTATATGRTTGSP